MPSQLAWIDHDATARERTLRVLSLFQEKESRDELGLGSVRDSFADQLFPGTSTIQTRLRYMLFVPWIYHSLEEKRLPAESFAIQADLLERDLVQPLMDSDDLAGVFGKTAGKSLKRLHQSSHLMPMPVAIVYVLSRNPELAASMKELLHKAFAFIKAYGFKPNPGSFRRFADAHF